MVETVAKRFYEALAKGKIYGVKCKTCGKWSFPPVTACRECGSRKVEWKTISGYGTVHYYSTSLLPPKKFAQYSPYAYGDVVLKEGPTFFAMVEGLDASTPEKIKAGNEKLPMKVKAKVAKKAGMNVVVFKVVK
ncbi:OB-fold domain-containing protein [Candidatus Woesearchaeota archaeon]|nr:OB-fold domain-containing protein [Candidatus Woesearchaeota archaeon]